MSLWHDGFEYVHSCRGIDLLFYLGEFVVCATSIPPLYFPVFFPSHFPFSFYTGVYAVKKNRITERKLCR